MALVTALALEVEIDIETFAGTNVIRRLAAFDLFPSGGPIFPETIGRLATQRNPDTGIHVLELFVAGDDGMETLYRAYDPAIQMLCHVAARSRRRLQFDREDAVITQVRVGATPARKTDTTSPPT
jgi:hypothetical protein